MPAAEGLGTEKRAPAASSRLRPFGLGLTMGVSMLAVGPAAAWPRLAGQARLKRRACWHVLPIRAIASPE